MSLFKVIPIKDDVNSGDQGIVNIYKNGELFIDNQYGMKYYNSNGDYIAQIPEAYSFCSDYSDKKDILYYDKTNKLIRSTSMDPDDIIYKVRKKKVFGEVYQLSMEEKQKYGITDFE
jgi:hypothetical protein